MVGVPAAVGYVVAKNYGVWVGIGAGLLSAVPCIAATCLFYRMRWRKCARRRQECKQKYGWIYRVVALPTDETTIKKPGDAEIKVGDYGWEAVPLRKDGLIYLQGLTPQWRVVWHAGFRPDQVEKMAPKQQSQYDWDQTWLTNAPPCPYPVQERETTTMGLPIP